jgi:hypothetical protein
MAVTEVSEWPELPTRPIAAAGFSFAPPGITPAEEAALVARASAEAPRPDPIRAALAADARHAPREAWLGLLLAAAMVGLVVQGWLWPLLALAFCAAPLMGILLESWDALRDRTSRRSPGPR